MENISPELEVAMTARNMPGIQEKLKSGKIAIAGLGGLGSNIAVMLARIGVGNLLLVDHDKVEPSNLNRQHYDVSHLGMLKTEALKTQLAKINPFIEIQACAVKVTDENATDVFKEYLIVCEAFDDPGCKAMLVNALLEQSGKKIIAASGLAGIGSANKIQTKQVFENLYVCGDSEPSLHDRAGFMAPRVMICAGHQANMAVRFLLDMTAP